MKKVVLLGSSGSIGKNVLEVIKHYPDEFKVVCLSVHQNSELLIEQAIKYKPESVIVTGSNVDKEKLSILKSVGANLYFGELGLLQAIDSLDYDILVNALVGAVGLLPTINAIKNGKTIAIANKETLVMAGEIVTALAQKNKSKLLPIDSEHSAIFQCLVGENIDEVKRIILTGSGGPFYNLEQKQFKSITVKDALNHPNWEMGKKITIDSATLMNKGLEIIEAFWLFGLPLEKINLVIHPQSIIHSLVEFVDGSIKAQMGWPDMKTPIQYALTYPFRRKIISKKLDLAALGTLTFLEPDYEKFPALKLALESIKTGGTAPAVLNASNEEAVRSFLDRKISFKAIPELIKRTLDQLEVKQNPQLDDILSEDKRARDFIQETIQSGKVANV